jgi:ribosome biogenesis GTPase A
MKQIQWYPGHMAKTKRQVKEKVKYIDIVLELLDARVPLSSQNPMIDELIGNTPKVILLNKADLADPVELEKWISYFSNKGIKALKISAQSGKGVNRILPLLKEISQARTEKEISRGRIERPIRTMILGIPNVGKSTLINTLAKKKKLVAEDRPGVTKQTQYIRVGQELELLDTPGILWPKFDDEEVAFRLALIGSIKDDILPIDDVCIYGFRVLDKYYKKAFEDRFDIQVDIDNIVKIYDDIGMRRGFLLKKKEVDYDKVSVTFLHEFRGGKCGPVILDRVSELEDIGEDDVSVRN